MTIVEAGYLPPVRAVLARLSGPVTESDFARWIELIDRALAWVPDGTEIVLMSNLHGYELDADAIIRDVLPARLAPHASRLTISKIAHVHHDATKMASYEATVGCEHERFFSDAAVANVWLLFDP